MKPRSRRAAAPVLVIAVMATVVWMTAGDLNPPAWPIAPTHKTLTEVEPRIAINATNTPGDADSFYRIAAPGSYYLTGDTTVTGSRSGIEIAASEVTIDLRGYTLRGSGAG